MSRFKADWDSYPGAAADKLNIIVSRSTNEQWNLAFGEGVMLAATIAEDSRVKSDYPQLATDAKTLNGGTTIKGSLYFVARKIDTVVPMMKTMIRGIASLKTKNNVS